MIPAVLVHNPSSLVQNPSAFSKESVMYTYHENAPDNVRDGPKVSHTFIQKVIIPLVYNRHFWL